MSTVKKTKSISHRPKKVMAHKTWENVTDGATLKKQLIEATKAYIDAGEKLKNVIGENSVIHNTFIGMRNIEKLENGEDKDTPAIKATAELCKRLKELSKMTGNLSRVHRVDFILIQKTKGEVFSANKIDKTTTTNTTTDTSTNTTTAKDNK